MSFVTGHIELISLITSMGIKMNSPEHIGREAVKLLNDIAEQQSEELKEIN
jgi:hypothetical protein